MRRNLVGKKATPYLLMVMIYSLMFPVQIFALPQGGNVVAGQANIAQSSAQNMEIVQSTSKAAIDWQQFSIATQESVRFIQPDTSSVALNRVIGVDPSLIYGQLTANGSIVLVNPTGIVVGPSGRINVFSFLASTLDIANQDFMSGNYSFSQQFDASLASILNQGSISAASGGSVSLIAPGIENQGTITASLGTVNLGAGEQVTLNFAGNSLISFVVDKAVTGEVLGADGTPVENAILNTGTISADGGAVTLEAKVAYDAIKSVVNNQGVIEARTIDEHNGVIRLLGNDQGIVYNSGTLDVTGDDAGEIGGTVEVTGEKTAFVHYSQVLASGRSGGGKVYVGGGYQGSDPVIQNGKITYVGENAVIEADAIDQGDGGEVIVWADDDTEFHGTVSATGGSLGGDGGFVEISGKDTLLFNGLVDTRAPLGETGMLLLDPTALDVVNGTASAGEIEDATIVTNLGTTGVTLLASSTDDPTDNTGSGIITFKTGADISWTSGNDFLVTADDNNGVNIQSGTITVESGVTISHTDGGSGTANLTFNAGTVNLGSDISVDGTLSGTATAINVLSNSASIQDGIDVADAGATVTVSNGTYTEDLEVNKASLTLKSVNGEASTTIQLVDGVGIDIQGGADGFTLGGTGVGFTIDDSASTTFDIQIANAPSGVTLADNTIVQDNAATMGISVGTDGAEDLTITGNTFNTSVASSGSIWGPNMVDVAVVDNTFNSDNSSNQPSYAIQFSGVTVNDGTSVISGNTIDSYKRGIVITNNQGVSNLSIVDNTIQNSTNEGILFAQDASYLNGGTEGTMTTVTVQNNTLTGNVTGLAVWNHANIHPENMTISGNAFTGNTAYGLDNQHTTALSATGNYWGDATGPSDSGSGTGDKVSTNVDYSPWWAGNYVDDAHASAWTWGTDDSINDAISLATAGDIVNIVGGNYSEEVAINKSLTLAVVSGTAAVDSLAWASGASNIGLSGNFSTDSGNIDFSSAASVYLTGSVSLDTEQGGDGTGGSVNMGTSLYAKATGYDLSIDTASTAGDGQVSIGGLSNSGGGEQYVDDLTITAGTVDLTGGVEGITISGVASITTSTDIAIDHVITANTIAIDATGAMTGTSLLTAQDTGTTALDITASKIGTDAANAINVASAGEVTLTTTGTDANAGDIFVKSTSNALKLGVLTVDGANAQTVDIRTATSGDITVVDTSDLGSKASVVLNSAGGVVLSNDLSALTMDIDAAGTLTGAGVLSVSDTGTTALDINASKIGTDAANAINVASAGEMTLTTTGTDANAGDIFVKSTANALKLGVLTVDGTNAQTVDIRTATSGDITVVDASDLGSKASVVLNSAGGVVLSNDLTALTMDIDAAGTLTGAGVLSVSDTGTTALDITAAKIGASGAAINVVSGGTVNLASTATGTANAGDIYVTTADSEFKVGTLSVAEATEAQVVDLEATGTGSISFGSSSTLANNVAVALDSATSVGVGTATLSAGSMSVDAGGAISGSGVLKTTAGSLTLTSTGGDIGTDDANRLGVSVTGGTLQLSATGSDVFVTSADNLTVSAIETAAAQADTVAISTTGTATLELTGAGGYTNVETDAFDLDTANGSLAISTNPLTAGSFDIDTTGGNVVVGAAVKTSDVTVTDDGSDNAAQTGNIDINSGGILTGAGSLTTGNATVDGTGSGVGADSATSGSITISVAGTADPAIQLAGAITTGNATVTNASGDETATSGDLSLSSTNGTIGTNASTEQTVLIGTASGANTNDQGALSLSAPGHGIYVDPGASVVDEFSLTLGSGDSFDLTIGNATITVNDSGGNLSIATIENDGSDFDFTLTADSGSIVLADNAISNIGAGTVNLTSSGTISGGSGTAIATTGSAVLTADSGISLNTAVSTLSASTNSGGINIANIGGLTIGGAGITSSGGIQITASSPITINSDVNEGTGNVFFAALGSTDADDLTINANITTAGTGTIDLWAGDDIIHTAGTISQTGSGILNLRAGVDYNDGSTYQAGYANSGQIVQSGTAAITGNDGAVNLRATDSIILTSVNASSGGGNVNITADDAFSDLSLALSDNSGSITEAVNATTRNIILGTGTLALTAPGDIGASGSSLDVDTAKLVLDSGQNFYIAVDSADAGTNAKDLTDLTITATAGNFDHTLTAAFDAALTITDDATDFTELSVADNSDGLNFTFTAANTTAGEGDISVGTVNVGGSSNVSLTSSAGSILDAGDDTNTDITSANAVLTAATGVGATGGNTSLETSADNLNVSITGTGTIDIAEDNAVILSDVDTNNGGISVSAGGTLTADDVAAGGNGDVSLASTGNIVVGDGGISTGSGTVVLNAVSGSITEGTTNTTTNITTSGVLDLTAGSSIGDTAASGELDTAVGTLRVNAGGTVDILESDGLILGDGTSGVTSSGGAITIETTAGNISTGNTVTTSGGDYGITLGSGGSTTIGHTLTANGAGAIDINSGAAFTLSNGITMSSTTGAIEVDTTGANALTVNGTIQTGGSGTIDLTGTDAIAMDTDSLIQSANGAITLESAANGVAVDVITSTDGTISITATGSTIDEVDDDTTTNITTSGVLDLTAGSSIGDTAASGELDTAVGTLRVSAGGTVDILESDGLILGDGTSGVTSSGGAITIETTAGNISTGNTVTTSGGDYGITLGSGGSTTIGHTLTANGAGAIDINSGGSVYAFQRHNDEFDHRRD